ncbi:hypothetical protein CK203_098160 [Vitis vinifera]|uniref:Uncharacterized protein n=1 Tax=Vitis vinifera TaxID=29760 RepID=A0A438C0T0_VITVI|nr:hypothetical protein CK203_098160 [Vitis vinifera]
MVRTLKVSMERKTFLVRLEGESGGKWCSLTEHSRGSVFALGFEKEEVGWLIEHLTKAIELKSYMGFNRKYKGKSCVHLMEVQQPWKGLEQLKARCLQFWCPLIEYRRKGKAVQGGSFIHKHVGPLYRSFTNELEKKDRGEEALFQLGGQKGVVTIVPFSGGKVQLRRWLPRENLEVVGKFRGGWIELRGLPFHLWSEEHLKKIVKQWGMVTEIDWRTLKLFDLCKLQWSEMKTLGEVEKWVSELGRILSLTRGQVVEDGLRELDQRLKEFLLLEQLGLHDEVWFKEAVDYSFPPSSGFQQGFRSRSEPLTQEKPSSDCEAHPKVVAFRVGTQMERGFSVCPLTCCRLSGFQKRCSGKGASLSRGDVVLCKSSNVEDRASYKGRVGFDHRGIFVFTFSVIFVNFSPPFGLALPPLSPSVPVLPSLVFQSQFPMKIRAEEQILHRYLRLVGIGWSLQEVLPRWISDHWTIVLDTNPFKWGPTPFRFENMWLQHPSFKECFSTWWRSFQGNGWEGHKFMRKLQFVKAKLKDRDKAPRPDGFTIVVFQDRWDVIKEDLVRVFAEFHRSAFVQGRQILDAVRIANEIVDEKDAQERKEFSSEWNKGWVKATRGLRQGDPLSPFLFTIVADVLSRMLLRAEERKDLQTLKTLLLAFEHISGLKVNLDKSNLLASTLIRIIFLVAAKIEKLQRDFLWSRVGEGKRDHLVSWDVVCNSKVKGGLGFGKISLRNLSLLGKWLWRYLRESSALWHQEMGKEFGWEDLWWGTNLWVSNIQDYLE